MGGGRRRTRERRGRGEEGRREGLEKQEKNKGGKCGKRYRGE